MYVVPCKMAVCKHWSYEVPTFRYRSKTQLCSTNLVSGCFAHFAAKTVPRKLGKTNTRFYRSKPNSGNLLRSFTCLPHLIFDLKTHSLNRNWSKLLSKSAQKIREDNPVIILFRAKMSLTRFHDNTVDIFLLHTIQCFSPEWKMFKNCSSTYFES